MVLIFVMAVIVAALVDADAPTETAGGVAAGVEPVPRKRRSRSATGADPTTLDDLDTITESGPPFDVVRGAFHAWRKEILREIEETWGVKAMDNLKRYLRDDELAAIQEHRKNEIALLTRQLEVFEKQSVSVQQATSRLFMTVLLAVLGWLGTIVVIYLKLFADGK